ncbi:MAG: DUF11 domain-containing protein [Rubrobacteraceae bacterium]
MSTRAGYFAGFVGFLVVVMILLAPAGPARAQAASEADLSVQKFDFPPDRVAVGETLFYELVIANLGPDTATNAIVTDTLPANTEFLSTITGNCTNVGRTVTCDLEDLGPSEQVSVEFSVCPTSPGTATNTATATSGTTDPNPANDTATETTIVTTPAVGRCPSQQSPPPGNPPPGTTPPVEDPRPDPIPPPDSPQPEVPVADAGLCVTGAVAIEAQDFEVACAGGQSIATRGAGPGGILTGFGTGDEGSGGDQAIVQNADGLAVAGNGGVLVQKP